MSGVAGCSCSTCRESKDCYSVAHDGIYTIIGWTLSDGREVVSAFIPVGHRDYPDGKVIIGGCSFYATGAANREESMAIALELLWHRIAEAA